MQMIHLHSGAVRVTQFPRTARAGFRSAAATAASGERKKNVRAFVPRLPAGNPGERPKP